MLRKLWIVLAVVAALAFGAELAFRLLAPRLGIDRAQIQALRDFLLRGELANYEPVAYTVFRRPRREPFNSSGFNDVEWSRTKTPGVPRILCLGSSTTEGGNPSAREGSYPHFLERTLESRTGRDFEVLNAGISGWTSAEVLVAWFLNLQDLEPDLVVIHEGVNDLLPRFRADFRADYTHWRVPCSDSRASELVRLLAHSDLFLQLRLQRHGVPDIQTLTRTDPTRFEPLMKEGRLPSATAAAFHRNVASIARHARRLGAEVALMTMPWDPTSDLDPVWAFGMAEHNRLLAELAAEQGYILVDAARAFEERASELAPEFLDFVHVTPRGNEVKAELVAEALAEKWGPAMASGTISTDPRTER